MTYKLLGVGNNAKTIKGDGSEYLTAILYMTPYKVMVDGKLFNSCAMAQQASCIDACLVAVNKRHLACAVRQRSRLSFLYGSLVYLLGQAYTHACILLFRCRESQQLSNLFGLIDGTMSSVLR